MIISFSPQNSIASSSSPNPDSLRFGVKRPRKQVKAKSSAPKTADKVDLKGKKRKPQVTERKLWEKIEHYKSIEETNFADEAEIYLEADFRRFLPKGTYEEKSGIFENFLARVRANPFDILKRKGKGSLDLKDFHRRASTFQYVSPSVSRSSSPGPLASKNLEASQEESPLVASHRTNRNSPAFPVVSQPVFPTQKRRESNASSTVFFGNPGGINGLPEFTMPDPHEPVPSPYALHGQSPFHHSLDSQSALPNEFEEQLLALTQGNGNIPAPASNHSLHYSDLLEGSIIQSDRSATKVATNLQKGNIKEEFIAKLAKYARIARNKKEETKRNDALATIPEKFKQAIGVEQLTDTQRVIMLQLVQDCRDSKKLDVMDYLKRATQEVSDAKSLSSEDSASVVSAKQPGNSTPRSHRSQMNAMIQSHISDTASQSYDQTKSWVETQNPLSTKATSPSPFISAGNAPSLSLPQTSEALPRAASFKKEPAPSTTFSELLSELGEAPASPKKADDTQSLSSALTSVSKLSSTPSQNSFPKNQEYANPAITRRKPPSHQADSNSASEIDKSLSVESSSGQSSEDNFSDYSGPKRKRLKTGAMHSTTKATGSKAVSKNKKLKLSLSAKPKPQVAKSKVDKVSTAQISKEELEQKLIQLSKQKGKDRFQEKSRLLLQERGFQKFILKNVKRDISAAQLVQNTKFDTNGYIHALSYYNTNLGKPFGWILGRQDGQYEAAYELFLSEFENRTDKPIPSLIDEFKLKYPGMAFHDSILKERITERKDKMGVKYGQAGTAAAIEARTKTKLKDDRGDMIQFAIGECGDCDPGANIYAGAKKVHARYVADRKAKGLETTITADYVYRNIVWDAKNNTWQEEQRKKQ